MLSVLVIFWLNLAVMPCTMALETIDTTPHCPPPAEQEMAHHGHQDTQAIPDCFIMQSDCCGLVNAALDTREGTEKRHDHASAAVSVTSAWPSLHILVAPQHEPRPPDPGTHYPPLHVLNCVYLD